MQSAKGSGKTLSVPDELHLAQITVPNIPDDIIFPDELNRYLRDQVQYLTHENGMLYQNLSDAELQLKQSNTKLTSVSNQLEEYTAVCPKNSLTSSVTNIASSKIVELSKKLRERNSEIEVFKTKCSKLEQFIIELDKREKQSVQEVVSEVEKPKNELEEQIKSLQEKLTSTNAKLCEIRNSNAQLKTDLKMANKLLQQEIGENFETLTNPNTNWRGRAQIICDLQSKNCDIKEKLKNYRDKEKGRNVAEAPPQTTKHEKRIETLTKENIELKNNMQDVKRKLEATKARSKVLESDALAYRGKVSTITEQSDRDHELITSLGAKVCHAQEIQNEAVHQKQLIIQKMEKENRNLQMDVAKQKCKMDNFQAQVDEQRREIETLREKIKKQHPLSYNPPNTIPMETKTINQLEAERLRLLELTKLGNDRLESERTAHSATQSKCRSERQKAAKLEAKVARLQLEQHTERSSSYSMCSLKSKETENTTVEDKLQLAEETVKALETRLQIERQEHKTDIEEFTTILRNYGYAQKTDNKTWNN